LRSQIFCSALPLDVPSRPGSGLNKLIDGTSGSTLIES
jgi:hypothetical protein